VKYLLKQLTIAAILAIPYAVAHASTIDFVGRLTGAASIDTAARCAPFPTVSATGAGVGTLLGDFADVQSDCMTSESSFDQGTFDFTSVSNPEDSLFGTYFAVASSQDGLLDLTSILVVSGGTGLFTGDFGAIFGFGTLDVETGILSETFSGELQTTVPEPGTWTLIAVACAVLGFVNRKRIWVDRRPAPKLG